MYGYYYDPTYILVCIGAVLCVLASAGVNSTYKRYARVRNRSHMTGAEAAARILSLSGIHDVEIQHVSGDLTDHYDPSKKVLRLSDSVYGSTSVAAIGVAAHECGHAVQHQKGYLPLKIRSALVPAANLGSKFGLPMVIIGLIIGVGSEFGWMVATIGIWVFALAVLFQIITLPVEFNASHRALVMLKDYNMLSSDEISGCKKVLTAAAMTYVAAAASSILQLLRLILLSGRRRRD